MIAIHQGSAHALTSACASRRRRPGQLAACSFATRATPARSFLLTRARSLTARRAVARRRPCRRSRSPGARVVARSARPRPAAAGTGAPRRARPRARRRAACSDEVRPVAHAGGSGSAGGSTCVLRALVAAERRARADLAEREPAEAVLRDLLEDRRRVRRERRRRSARRAARSTRARPGTEGRRAAQALQPALEVDVGAVALEVARPREDEIGPAEARPWNIETAITDSAGSASARTFGSFAASSPETISSPIESRLPPSSSETAPTRRRRRGRSAWPGRRTHPALPAGETELLGERATTAPPRPPDRTRSARRVPPRRSRRRRDDARAVAPRLASPRGRRSARSRSAGRRRGQPRRPPARSPTAAAGTRRARPKLLPGALRVRAEALPHELAERVRLLDRLGAGQRDHDLPCCARSSDSATSSASSHETGLETAPPDAMDRVDERSAARRCVNPKRPLSHNQPSSISAWLRERTRFAFPSRRSTHVLQPTGHMPQTVGTLWISHGRALKRYCVGRSAPTGQSSVTLPVKPRCTARRRTWRSPTSSRGPRDELSVLANRLAEARAAVAEDAALAVERDRRRDRNRLLERRLLERHPRLPGP